jgi:hypothetical protein
MSSHTAPSHHTGLQRTAAAAGLAGALALVGLAGPALAKPVGPGDVAKAGASSGQQGPPSFNSSWSGYTAPQSGGSAPRSPVALTTEGVQLAQVGLGALGGAALAGVGALALGGLHRRQRAAHA